MNVNHKFKAQQQTKLRKNNQPLLITGEIIVQCTVICMVIGVFDEIILKMVKFRGRNSRSNLLIHKAIEKFEQSK